MTRDGGSYELQTNEEKCIKLSVKEFINFEIRRRLEIKYLKTVMFSISPKGKKGLFFKNNLKFWIKRIDFMSP